MNYETSVIIYHVLGELCCLVAADSVDSMPLSINSDMSIIVRAMAKPNSGLEVRDRLWLKITIPNAFIGRFDTFQG